MSGCKKLCSGLVLGLAVVLMGCSDGADKKRPKKAHLVEVVEVAPLERQFNSEYAALLEARRVVKIITQEEGRLLNLPVREGDRVKEGDVLARLDDALLKAELNKLVAKRKQAEQELKRLRKLRKSQLISVEQLSRAQTAYDVARADESALQTRVGYMTLRAPFDGVIDQRLVEPGDILPRHTHSLTLLDDSQLIAKVGISELSLPLIQPGLAVRVRIDALGDVVTLGHVIRVYPSVDEKTRQGVVEVALKHIPEGALSGQLCRIAFELPASGRPAIPLLALRQDDEGSYVFRLDAENKVQRRAVGIGRHIGEYLEILHGVKAGERVVVKGFMDLKDGMSVKVVGDGEP